MTNISLFFLGTPIVEQSGIPLNIRYSKAMAMLIYLAVTGEPQRRETLATLLWPESTHAVARSSLRRELSLLNKAIGNDVIISDNKAIGVSSDIWLDVAEFVNKTDDLPAASDSLTPQLESAVKLYRSDFLTGFSLSNCQEFNDWQFFQTENLRDRFASSLKRLVEELNKEVEYEKSILHARRWLALDTLHEPAHRMLMQLYALSGRHADALRQFSECQHVLRNELGVEPEQETRELELAIRERKIQPANIMTVDNGKVSSPAEIISDHSYQSPPTVRHNLPAYLTPFVGRAHDIDTITDLISGLRLITILAPGGMGKTRLSIEVAKQFLSLQHTAHGINFSDGVFFISLVTLSFSDEIVTTLADNIGFVFHGDTLPKRQLIDFLKNRAMLLVFDNFEHLTDGAELITDILSKTQHISVIVTSRERLNLHDETVYYLDGLAFPAWQNITDAKEFDAVKLFVQSAKRALSDFALHHNDLDALHHICQLTDGMPLGLELAAGWVDILSLQTIAKELQQSLDILDSELRDLPERHRSLRATFERTWNRLTDEQQAVFSRLSVFNGGFTVDSAETIAGASIFHLRKLTQKSLLQPQGSDRFTIHELLRQFGADKLARNNESAQIEAKHAEYFVDFMVECKQGIKTNWQLEAINRIDADYDNIRSVWFYIIDNALWSQLPDFLHSLWFYCDARSLGQDAFNLLQYAIDQLEEQPPADERNLALSRVKARQSWFCTSVGKPQQGKLVAQEALGKMSDQNDLDTLMFIRYSLGYIYLLLDQQNLSVQSSKEGLDIAQEIQDSYWEGHFLQWIGFANVEMENFTQGIEFSNRALRIHKRLNNYWGIKNAYDTLGDASLGLQRFDDVKRYYEHALEVAMMLDHPFSIAYYNRFLGEVALHERKFKESMRYLTYSVKIFWDIGYTWIIPVPMLYIAKNYADCHDYDSAIEIVATLQHVKIPHTRNIHFYKKLHAQLKTRVDPEHFAQIWKRGQQREFSELVYEQVSASGQ